MVESGGDADTNGAITGGLLDARFGDCCAPQLWLAALKAVSASRAVVDRMIGDRVAPSRGSTLPGQAKGPCAFEVVAGLTGRAAGSGPGGDKDGRWSNHIDFP